MLFDGPMAIMMPGPEDRSLPAVFFVNDHNPFKQPKWKIRQAVLREIAPGRLYQVSPISQNLTVSSYLTKIDSYEVSLFSFFNVHYPFKQPKWKIRQAVLRGIAPGLLYQQYKPLS